MGAGCRPPVFLDRVLDRFFDDLRARGVPFAPPSDPLHEEAFVETLAKTYLRAPSVFEPAAGAV